MNLILNTCSSLYESLPYLPVNLSSKQKTLAIIGTVATAVFALLYLVKIIFFNPKKKMTMAKNEGDIKISSCGEVIFADGSIACGAFKNEKLQGEGIFLSKEGLFEGKFDQGTLIEGNIYPLWRPDYKGKFKDGVLYEGKLGLFSEDEYIQIYECEKKGNDYIGKGTEVIESKSFPFIFEGNIFFGIGKMIFENGDCKEGYFLDCQLHGKGKSISEFETVEGIFKQGKLEKGKITQQDFKAEGRFKEGILVNGEIFYENRIERGVFDDGQLIEGKIEYFKGPLIEYFSPTHIKIVHPNGILFEGCDKNGVYKGKIHKNEKVFEGEFHINPNVWFEENPDLSFIEISKNRNSIDDEKCKGEIKYDSPDKLNYCDIYTNNEDKEYEYL